MCKKAAPLYEKLKEELDRDDIIIAKFNADANDVNHPNVNITSYPTFILFKADDYDNPIRYTPTTPE